MCGLAGWIDLKVDAAHPSILARMTAAIAHRGPDGSGEYHTQTRDGQYAIALGHRRLAIIDPLGGDQPMFSPDRQIALVYNGEIYNFQNLREELRIQGFPFETNSDTEVLLNAWRAWGVDCLRRLRGMFAFALWDAGRETLLIARDRFGKKPIFFHTQDERVLFASEIKSILSYPDIEVKQDKSSALDYLQYRYVPGPSTMFAGIEKLMPGSYALWHKGKMTRSPYATPSDGDAKAPMCFAAHANPLEAFTQILDESIRLRMISDVPFGAFLSGGLDSSAIVALMSRHSNLPINTFSVGFKEADFDETVYAQQIAERFKTSHHEWKMEADDVIKLLPEAIRYRDAPVAEPTDVAVMVLARHAAKSVKMVLTGEGSDEILAGYPKHRYEPYVACYQKWIPTFVHRSLLEPLVDALPASYFRAQTVLHAFGLKDVHERMPRWFGALDPTEIKKLVALSIEKRPSHSFAFANNENISDLRRCLYFDQRSWLPDNLLERGDRMTMAASIEARMPFIDHELAAFMSSLPDTARIKGGVQKWILRQAMRDILPSQILERPKVGFKVPVGLWFRTSLKDYVFENLLGPYSRTKNLYHRDFLQKILGQHVNGSRNHEKLIWMLLSFELFQKEYSLSL